MTIAQYQSTNPLHLRRRRAVAAIVGLTAEGVLISRFGGLGWPYTLVILTLTGVVGAGALFTMAYEVDLHAERDLLVAKSITRTRQIRLTDVTEIGRLLGRSGGPGLVRYRGGHFMIEIGVLGTIPFDELTELICTANQHVRNSVRAHPRTPAVLARLIPDVYHPALQFHDATS